MGQPGIVNPIFAQNSTKDEKVDIPDPMVSMEVHVVSKEKPKDFEDGGLVMEFGIALPTMPLLPFHVLWGLLHIPSCQKGQRWQSSESNCMKCSSSNFTGDSLVLKSHVEELQKLNALREKDVRRAEKSACGAAAAKGLSGYGSMPLETSSLSLQSPFGPKPEVEFTDSDKVDTRATEDPASIRLDNTDVVIVEDHVIGEDHVGDEGPVDGQSPRNLVLSTSSF
ncbi:hypothetical protein Bca4012_065149 [Brassica carinata]